jgi:hypothetical protein
MASHTFTFDYISLIYLGSIQTLCFKTEIRWLHGPGSTTSPNNVVSNTHPNTSAHKPLLADSYAPLLHGALTKYSVLTKLGDVVLLLLGYGQPLTTPSHMTNTI